MQEMLDKDAVLRIQEYLKKVGPSHPYQISKALGYSRETVKSALEQLRNQGKILHRIPSYYVSHIKPVIPFREWDPSIVRRQIPRYEQES